MKLPSLSSRLESLLVPLSTLVSAMLVVATATTLWITYAEVERKAQRYSLDTLHLTENHVSREADMWLFALDLAASLTSPADGLSAIDRQHILFRVAERLPSPVALFLVDVNGNVVADPLDAVPSEADVILRPFVKRLGEADDRPLFSEPVRWLPGGGKALLVGRNLRDEQGRFVGGAVVAVALAQLQQIIRAIGVGEEGLGMVILSVDGAVVASFSPPGMETEAHDLYRRVRELGGARGPAAMNTSHVLDVGQQRLTVTTGIIPRTDLLPVVWQSTARIYTRWWERLLILSAVTGVMCVAALLLAVNLRSELGRRRRAEIAMAALATTDGLTGLANRRRFDEVMQRERDRACRARTSLSLLAMDADRFKRINDSYGHAVGDEVLRLLGRSIAGQLRRPGDFAARTGGEEFAVILPETDIEGACHVAERIRADFSERTARFFEERDGCTLSVGIKQLETGFPETVSQMLTGADAALYAAKQAGRDRVIVAPASRPAPSVDRADGGPDPLWPEGLAGCFA